MPKNDDRKYFKWGLTALGVIFISILLVVIFTNLPGFFAMIRELMGILSPLIIGVVIAFLLNPLANFVDCRLQPFLLRRKMKPEKAEKLRNRIHENIDKYNDASEKPYKIGTSIGWHIETLGADKDFNALITKADLKMYREKRNKSTSREGRQRMGLD